MLWERPPASSAVRLEEGGEQGAARFLEHPALDRDAMVEPRVPYDVAHAPAHPRLYIVCPEYQPPDFSEHERACALGAGLERDVQGTVFEAIARGDLQRLLNREQLGVGGGIAARDRLIVRPDKNVAVAGDHRADRDLVVRRREPRL